MSKLEQFYTSREYLRLRDGDKSFLQEISKKHGFSHQQIKQIIDISVDLGSWDEGSLQSIWPKDPENLKGKQLNTYILGKIKEKWNRLKNEPTDYTDFTPKSDFSSKPIFIQNSPERTILGECPVASEKTRCCNLKTLDAVINCGFDCSYCTIQSFYKGGMIHFEENLKEKLESLELDPDKRYHIGTGQSSDSLMWGNRGDTLKHLFEFAHTNPNVILELKTKSSNIDYLLENPIPKNVITTWSINTQTIIDNEEHLTASLEERLLAAKKIADKGNLVGFHFHPMVYYKGWKEEYGEVASRITDRFNPDKVALVSIGTLTYIKPVIKKIRERDFKTKILQMPLEDAEGKYSYPYAVKKEMFSHLYNSFSSWHNNVYFYMCMEDKKLWGEVFGKEYSSNEAFEEDMLNNYFTKSSN